MRWNFYTPISGLGIGVNERLTSRCSTRPMAAGHPFHCGFASITRAPLSLATWTPPAVKQRHLIPKRFETAALHSASMWALQPGPG